MKPSALLKARGIQKDFARPPKKQCVDAREVNAVPDWSVVRLEPELGIDHCKSAGLISAVSSPSVGPAASAGHIPDNEFFRHRLWSLHSDLCGELASIPDVHSKFKIASTKADSTMIVVNGNFSKQMSFGPSALISRCLGKAMVHVEWLKNPNYAHKPVFFHPLSKTGRCTTMKLFISNACGDKHKQMTQELQWLMVNHSSFVTARHKFELVIGDDAASSFLSCLKSCNTLQGTRAFKWLVTKDELSAAVNATAAVLSVPPNSIKHVMTWSTLVGGIGQAS